MTINNQNQIVQELGNCNQAEMSLMLVRQMYDSGVEREKIRVIVKRASQKQSVRNEIFKDTLGNQYVGCRLLERLPKSAKKSCKQVFETGENLAGNLKSQIDIIKQAIETNRRNYYAN
ncbi:hypothetical protein [Leuconostoc pseudomesenteroides]|uniref:hypothetical protein n=1 Tax=Leuconostoc pseudomesenteroides TaxID=33968 RepID=UPI0032DFB97A